jgi:NADH-quinone oxidoreductase subunit G
MTDKVTIEINGISLEAEAGDMLIDVADQAGIVIPRFCYHKKLSVAANCRMCLVEVEKAPKPLPACATPVMDGMKVQTQSAKALDSQRSVMEFLLINHPLDCPVCDQGGECPLQDTAMGFGSDVSRFTEGKRILPVKDLGPLVASEMTRCILCTRCVRFGTEIGGIQELGATGRGEHSEIGTYVEQALVSEVVGNVIDLCPVGALTSKPYRFSARPWELQHHASVSPHDGVGANLEVHTRRGKVMRVVAAENEAVNECWIADRDRYSYLGIHSDERLLTPRMKVNGQWRDVEWETALAVAADGIKAAGDRVGALVSPSATLEEQYLSQKLVRGLGSHHVDHRLRQIDLADDERAPRFPWLGQAIVDLESNDAVLMVGSHIRKEQPLLALRLRKAAVRNGARLMFANPVDYEHNFPVHASLVSAPQDLLKDLAAIAKVLKGLSGQRAPNGMAPIWQNMEPNEQHEAIAHALFEGKQTSILLGALAIGHPAWKDIRTLAALIAKMSTARLGILAPGGNAAGAWLAGAVPHRPVGVVMDTAADEADAAGDSDDAAKAQPGLDWRGMFSEGLDAYVLMGVEPELDCADPVAATHALSNANCVVALTPFRSKAMESYADILLPIGTFAETSGTLINVEGLQQSFKGAIKPLGEARPAWKVLRVLGNGLGLDGFDWFSSDQVLGEVNAAIGAVRGDNKIAWNCPESVAVAGGLCAVSEVPIYAVDALVRRSPALQATPDGQAGRQARINPATASELGIDSGGRVQVRLNDGANAGNGAELDLVLDTRVADACIVLPAGLAGTAGLSVCSALGETGIELTAVSADADAALG